MRASTGHLLTPELERSAPREVGLTMGGRALSLIAWLLVFGAFAAGGALYLEARRQSNEAVDFDRRSVTATAVVDRVWRKSGDGKPAFAAFHFDANGVRINGDKRMQLSAWSQLRAGSALQVRYLPDDPRRFAAAGQRRNGRMPFAVPYIVSSILTVIALLCLATIRFQRTLLSEGRAAPAIVTAVSKQQGAHGEKHSEMVYEFRVLAGTLEKGKAAASKTAAVGSKISVVYDPERPKRNRPYPFSLVTLARES
jgi:hypothetical protein